jgi:hypothetical protein
MNHCDDYNIKCPHMANICEWIFQRACPGERHKIASQLQIKHKTKFHLIPEAVVSKAMEGA